MRRSQKIATLSRHPSQMPLPIFGDATCLINEAIRRSAGIFCHVAFYWPGQISMVPKSVSGTWLRMKVSAAAAGKGLLMR